MLSVPSVQDLQVTLDKAEPVLLWQVNSERSAASTLCTPPAHRHSQCAVQAISDTCCCVHSCVHSACTTIEAPPAGGRRQVRHPLVAAVLLGTWPFIVVTHMAVCLPRVQVRQHVCKVLAQELQSELQQVVKQADARAALLPAQGFTGPAMNERQAANNALSILACDWNAQIEQQLVTR